LKGAGDWRKTTIPPRWVQATWLLKEGISACTGYSSHVQWLPVFVIPASIGFIAVRALFIGDIMTVTKE
jgi:hypothetical protein